MGRKSNKKKNRRSWVRKKPDEVYQYGPIEIARYGKFIKLENHSTLEEHEEFIKKLPETNKNSIKELESEILGLQNIISQLEPLEIMYRAVFQILPLFIKYASESEYSSEEVLALPSVEYLQYLLARTEPNRIKREMTETDWEELWGKTKSILRLTQKYLYSRKTISSPPSEIDELRFWLDGRRLLIRVRRYPFYFEDYLKTSLQPYAVYIKQVYSITVGELITGLKQIETYQRVGIMEKHKECVDATTFLMSQLQDAGFNVDPGASPEEVVRTRTALESDEFRNIYYDVNAKMQVTFTNAIFDISEISSLPEHILSLLSVKPAESILAKLTGENHDDLSPLSNSILHYKPFLNVNNKFYYFYHSGFEDRIVEIIEDDLFAKMPQQVSAMVKQRSNRLEEETKELLDSVLKPTFSHLNLFYPDVDNDNKLTELDILLSVDDILFLVEIKAGGFSDGAARGAPKDLEKKFNDLIIEGQRQSERAEKYIKSSEEVQFYDQTGKTVVLKISRSNYRKFFRVIVTKENLGWVGAKIAVLSILYPELSKSYPWHISFDDLRIVCDLFKENELRFIHFLEQRLNASQEKTLNIHDEIEHVALYNEFNYYHEPPVQGINRISYDGSFMKEIDYYFSAKYLGEEPEIPIQKLSTEISDFLRRIQECSLKRRFIVGSAILSLDDKGRDEFSRCLQKFNEGITQNKQRSVRLAIGDTGLGITVTNFKNINLNEEKVRSIAHMEITQSNQWYIVQFSTNNPNEVIDIIDLQGDEFPREVIDVAINRTEAKYKENLKNNKVGRNESCPCGSGKKFKKCHGQ